MDNIHSKSKIDNARQFLNQKSISPGDCIVVGDTYHDFEVAKELGCKCLLIDKGHQNLHQFKFDERVSVIVDITGIIELMQE